MREKKKKTTTKKKKKKNHLQFTNALSTCCITTATINTLIHM